MIIVQEVAVVVMETRFEQGQWWPCDDIRREIIPASNDPVAKKSPPSLGG